MICESNFAFAIGSVGGPASATVSGIQLASTEYAAATAQYVYSLGSATCEDLVNFIPFFVPSTGPYGFVIPSAFSIQFADIAWSSPMDGVGYEFALGVKINPDYLDPVVQYGTVTVTDNVADFSAYTGPATLAGHFLNIAGNDAGGFNGLATLGNVDRAVSYDWAGFIACAVPACSLPPASNTARIGVPISISNFTRPIGVLPR